ncbi:MAG: STAS domain-containing protein [bacterium]|nr:STAS domain-containing protein [bacterium]
MFDSDISGDKEAGIVVLKGSLTLANAESVKRLLGEIINRSDNIIVKIEGLEEIDLSFFQVLIAAYKSAAKLGKVIQLLHPDDSPFTDALKYSGFANYTRNMGDNILGFDLNGVMQ